MRLVFAPCLLALALFACAATENAAAKDPMRCERTPECASKSGRARDCTTQCNDDPACMDRCREMNQDHLGAPQ